MKKVAFLIMTLGLVFASCQDDDDPCEDLNCFNGGICVDGVCDCPPGYVGTNCQDFNPCDTIVCLNDAPCVFGVCACPPGYSGANCENFDACFDVTCENGGNCVDGSCDCPPNYTGENCENQTTPLTLTINAIQVTQFPLLNENGEPWDLDSNPDIFPKISKDEIVLYSAPNAIENAQAGGTFSWIPAQSITLSTFQDIHEFVLFEGDPNGESAEMGRVFFAPYTSENDFPDILEFNADSIGFKLQVEYTW